MEAIIFSRKQFFMLGTLPTFKNVSYEKPFSNLKNGNALPLKKIVFRKTHLKKWGRVPNALKWFFVKTIFFLNAISRSGWVTTLKNFFYEKLVSYVKNIFKSGTHATLLFRIIFYQTQNNFFGLDLNFPSSHHFLPITSRFY